jgi:uracil-DNA glycosylase family 4
LSNELAVLNSEVETCTKCELQKSRIKAVPGEGPENAAIMFVGEGPGQNEDQQGRPFVGAAGKLLTELLKTIGLDRSEVFITNIVKCRPPNNRAPRRSEVEACSGYLTRQIRLVNPRILCPLGTPAISSLLGEDYSATKSHGKPIRRENMIVLPMYHPAAALYDASLKGTLESDFHILKSLLEETQASALTKEDDVDRRNQTLEKWA